MWEGQGEGEREARRARPFEGRVDERATILRGVLVPEDGAPLERTIAAPGPAREGGAIAGHFARGRGEVLAVGASAAARAVIAEDGAYRIDGLAPGRYVVLAGRLARGCLVPDGFDLALPGSPVRRYAKTAAVRAALLPHLRAALEHARRMGAEGLDGWSIGEGE